MISLQQDGGDNRAILAHQDVIGAAGSCRIHTFHTDAGHCQLLVQSGVNETLLGSGSQQYDFGFQVQQKGKVLLG